MTDDIFDAPEPLSFPPLFSPQSVSGAIDPFDKACALATLGCESGLLVHHVSQDRLRAAIVLAPEIPLEPAMAMRITCGIGFQNALGALAPPEVGVHLKWDGGIMINGAKAGYLKTAASTTNPEEVPDWLVVGLEIQLSPKDKENPGNSPNETSLIYEGCADISPLRLLESWSRHTLVWINRVETEGHKPLHEEWRGLAHGIGEEITIPHDGIPQSGTYVGVDENFGMLLRTNKTTRLVPLSSRLEN